MEGAVRLLREYGGENIHYLSGPKIADETLEPLMPAISTSMAMGASLDHAAPILADEV